MYCEEPIQKAFYLESRRDNDGNWSFTDYFFEFAYYAAGKNHLVFQTKNHYITLGADGVKTWQHKSEFVTKKKMDG